MQTFRVTVPTVAEVERIAGMQNPVLRNLFITACYHDLSSALCERFGGVANWCSFATWASRQAGSTIRGEDVDRALESRLGRAPELAAIIEQVARLASHSGDVAPNVFGIRELLARERPVKAAADAVARGNLKVFEEIGREFARFLASGSVPDSPNRLQQAFRAYEEAAQTSDPVLRSQLICYANLQAGFHEQQRLQPEIREALDAARVELTDLRAHIIKLLLPGWWQRIRRLLAKLLGRPMPLDAAIDSLIDHVCEEIRELITAELMALRLPAGALRLGRTMSESYPDSLRSPAYAPLRELLGSPEIGRTAPRADERDWSDFSYRMFFIARLFRSHQERAELLSAPFSAGQLAELREGRVPSPPL